MTRVLITGASGAFGTATAAALRARGASVIGLDLEEGEGVLECDITSASGGGGRGGRGGRVARRPRRAGEQRRHRRPRVRGRAARRAGAGDRRGQPLRRLERDRRGDRPPGRLARARGVRGVADGVPRACRWAPPTRCPSAASPRTRTACGRSTARTSRSPRSTRRWCATAHPRQHRRRRAVARRGVDRRSRWRAWSTGSWPRASTRGPGATPRCRARAVCSCSRPATCPGWWTAWWRARWPSGWARARSTRPLWQRGCAGATGVDLDLVLDGRFEHEDLDGEVGVDVVLAHEGQHLAVELAFHDRDEVVAHRELEVVA